MVLAHTHTK